MATAGGRLISSVGKLRRNLSWGRRELTAGVRWEVQNAPHPAKATNHSEVFMSDFQLAPGTGRGIKSRRPGRGPRRLALPKKGQSFKGPRRGRVYPSARRVTPFFFLWDFTIATLLVHRKMSKFPLANPVFSRDSNRYCCGLGIETGILSKMFKRPLLLVLNR